MKEQVFDQQLQLEQCKNDRLNEIIRQQQEQIDRLKRLVDKLKDKNLKI